MKNYSIKIFKYRQSQIFVSMISIILFMILHEVLLPCISFQIEKMITMDIPTKTNKVQRDKLQPKRNDLLSYPTSNGHNF